MKLEHLKEQTCTICEALPEREYKGRQHTLEEKIKFSNRKDASLKLENYIYKLKVDEEFKDKLIENIRFVIYDYR